MYYKIVLLSALVGAVSAAVTINIFDDETKKVDDPKSDTSGNLEICNEITCNQMCRRQGYFGGECVGDYCKCDRFKLSEELDYDIGRELRSCDYRACDQLCRRLGFTGGVCVGDRCKCDNFLTKDIKQEDDSANINEQNKCSPLQCKWICASRNVPEGECDGTCDCERVEDFGDEILDDRWNEDNKKQNKIRGCDVVACNNMCHRLNYIGGMCRFGTCHCY